MPCVVSDEEKAPVRCQVGIRKANVSESLMKCRKTQYVTSKPGRTTNGASPQPDESCRGHLPVFAQAHARTCGQRGRPPPPATPRYVDHGAKCVSAGQVRCRCANGASSTDVTPAIRASASQT